MNASPKRLPTTDPETAERLAGLPGWQLWLRLDNEGAVITVVVHESDRRVLQVRRQPEEPVEPETLPGWPER